MNMTWESAVMQMRQDLKFADFVQACYFDDPLSAAAERYINSEEWQATRHYLPPIINGQAVDLGAGRGISSYALAKEGWIVSSLEPDPSDLVGAGAIRMLAKEKNLNIEVFQEFGEKLTFPDKHFDLVYGRQVLHHANELYGLCKEAFRVLKDGGTLVAVREHVVNNKESDLEKFLANHPLHRFYGGENAYTLTEYKSALMMAGFQQVKIIPPYSNVINYSVATQEEQEGRYKEYLEQACGRQLINVLWNNLSVRRAIVRLISNALDIFSTSPGRLYSFVAVKSK